MKNPHAVGLSEECSLKGVETETAVVWWNNSSRGIGCFGKSVVRGILFPFKMELVFRLRSIAYLLQP